MLTRLTKTAVRKVIDALQSCEVNDTTWYAYFHEKWQQGRVAVFSGPRAQDDDPITIDEVLEEYTFRDFMSDLIHEVAYRAEAGVDGNWIEFANDHGLQDRDYEVVIQEMRRCGFSLDLRTW